jgi:hypothetical protein
MFSLFKYCFNLFLNYISFMISSFFFLLFNYKKFTKKTFFIYGTSPVIQVLPVIFLAKILKIKIILWVQDLWPDALMATGHINNKFILKIVNLVTFFCYKNVDKIITQSAGFRKLIKQRYSLSNDIPIFRVIYARKF